MPLPLPFEEHGGLLKIRLSDLKKGEAFFPAESLASETVASAIQWWGRLMHRQDRGLAILSNTD